MAYAEVSGGRLWYEEAGSGPTIVLVHAGIVDSRMWDGQVSAFAERHRVVRYDLRFFGRSDRTPQAFSETDDLRELLDGLEIERAAVVGNSLGGRIALDFALAHPERVSALVPVAAGLPGVQLEAYSEQQDADFEAAIASGDHERATQIELEVWAPLGDDGRIAELVRDNLHVNTVEVEPRPLEPPASERLGEIRAPALVVTGDADVPGMTRIGDKLETEIPGARRVVIEGADHLVPLRRPEEFNRAVLDFLAGG